MIYILSLVGFILGIGASMYDTSKLMATIWRIGITLVSITALSFLASYLGWYN